MQVQEINEIINEIKQKVIRDCFGEDAVNIVKTTGTPWNCFVERKDGRTSFITGGYWNYISTLIYVLKTLKKELEKEISLLMEIENKIKEEWEAIIK